MLYRDYLLNKRVYQEQGTQLLLEKKHACLFYKPGKGKTYPVVDALQQLSYNDKELRVLILSTKDAIENMWLSEIDVQNIMPKNTVYMTVNSAIQDKTSKQLLAINWDVVVVDESHKIKSHNSKISKLVYLITKNCKYAWGLTGTPRGNSDVDIYCQFHNLNISGWGDISYSRFVDTCCTVEQQYFKGVCIKKPTGIRENYKAGWEKNIVEYSQRIDYDETDKMPELKTVVNKIPFVKSKEYKNAEQGIVQIPDYETTMAKLSAINKLHQAANGYIYWNDEQDITKIFKFEKNKKLDWLKENLIENPTIIVYQYKEDFRDLCEYFGDRWTEDIKEFKLTAKYILLLQCSRCESFNLQMCNNIIFYTMDYSYIKYNQMLHRIWRVGQEKDVTINILLFENSVEEDIWNAVKNKEKAADLFMSIKGGLQ